MPPHLQALGNNAYHLVVDGKPFLMRAAELNNSSMSSVEWMDDAWGRLVQSNVNTVLGSVGWEQIEPQEGVFDFTVLDAVIAGARKHGLKLIILWFGVSTYTPHWVKLDAKRFPRARVRHQDGKVRPSHSNSLFDDHLVEADVRAFQRLMRHLGEVDDGTVIAVQVENETGLKEDSRDRCAQAEAAFEAPVPLFLHKALIDNWDSLNPVIRGNLPMSKDLLHSGRSWEDTFGQGTATDELFMAYHFARYVDRVATAGKEIYPLLMYTNGWLRNITQPLPGVPSGGTVPGLYPSGSPNDTVIDIWQLCTPSLDWISPDIYAGDYEQWCRTFSWRNKPLFIPEQRHDLIGALQLWAALGSHHAIGASPFGLDGEDPATSPYTKHFGLVKKFTPLILSARTNRHNTFGFFFDPDVESNPNQAKEVTLGEWKLVITRAQVPGRPGPAFGMIIQIGPNKFQLLGEGFQIIFTSARLEATYTGILSFEEKDIDDNGKLEALRWLNGDETGGGVRVIMPSEVIESRGPVAVFIPARTRLSECEVYTLDD